MGISSEVVKPICVTLLSQFPFWRGQATLNDRVMHDISLFQIQVGHGKVTFLYLGDRNYQRAGKVVTPQTLDKKGQNNNFIQGVC